MSDIDNESSIDCEEVKSENSGNDSQLKTEILQKILEESQSKNCLDLFVQQQVDDDYLLCLDMCNSEQMKEVLDLLPTVGARGRFKASLRKIQVRMNLKITDNCFRRRKA